MAFDLGGVVRRSAPRGGWPCSDKEDRADPSQAKLVLWRLVRSRDIITEVS